MTAMSRKFYQSLAVRYKAHRPDKGTHAYPTWLTMVVATANVISEGNPSFDRHRFLTACGMTDHEVMAAAGA
jgi:hypothetical protein